MMCSQPWCQRSSRLLQVPGLAPAQARALYDAGICTPHHLAVALEEEVRAAAAKALPRNGKAALLLHQRGLSVGVTGNAATNALVARATRQLMAAAQEWVLSSAEQEHALPRQLATAAAHVSQRDVRGSCRAWRRWIQDACI